MPSLSLSQVNKCQRFVSHALVLIPSRGVVRLLKSVYASMESCSADCYTTNGEVVSVPAEVEVLSVDLQGMDGLAILLETISD